MKASFNKEGLMEYPAQIRGLLFGNWRWEDQNGEMSKVPYQPGTAFRARVNEDGTLSTLDAALAEIARYDGVCVKMSGNVACIDLDDCILPDGMLTENAQKVLRMLPQAWVEVSPSGTGLHLFFIVPEGFVFDSSAYYINNRAVHMENYFPGSTNHFMTVTGNIHRKGSMLVAEEQLAVFQDTFMKRPEKEASALPVPEGGSILTDDEVIAKAAASPTGQKFMDLYRGIWEEYGSQSEADLALCAMLAFYCRGDMGQMDLLFRESGLMREKWDRVQSGSTYGEITMKKAVSGCTAFYEKGYRADSGEDFADLPDAPEEETESGDACRIKSIDEALEAGIDIDTAFSEAFLANAVWAYSHDPARFAKIRQKLPREVGVRDFMREVKKLSDAGRADVSQQQKNKVSRLMLSGIRTPGMLVPGNWIVDDTGIRHMEMVFGELAPVRITAEPLFITAKLVNVDEGTEKLEVTFRRNGRYKTLIAPRADLLNKNAIIRYADEGFPVSSGTAGTLTKYIAEMEALNNRVIPIRRSIRRAGWIGDEFFPYSLKNGIVSQSDGNETERILAALKKEGSETEWMEMAAKVRTMPFARAMLAASFASPLLEKLQNRVIYLHIWHSTQSGKTAALKFAMSVWGDPLVLVSKYFSTIVGMERWSGTLKHLPFALDELQTLNTKRLSVNDIVYTLGNGNGKTRGRVGAGLQKVETWRNCILSTGEQPMSSDNSMDGVNTRLLELYACPLSDDGKSDPDVGLGAQMHRISERNYGYAGEKYIRYLVESVLPGGHRLTDDYSRIRAKLEETYPGSAQLDSTAVLALADYYSSLSVFGEAEDVAFKGAARLGFGILGNVEENRHQDSITMAWDHVCGWVASNKLRFTGGSILHEVTPLYGTLEDKKVFAICSELNKALEDAGFSVRKCIKGFQERGYIKTFTDSQGKVRSQTGKRIKGILTRVYALDIEISDDGEKADTILPLTGKGPMDDEQDFLQ